MEVPATRFQKLSSELFGRTAGDLKRQLAGPVKLPLGTTEADLDKLDAIAKQAWMTGKGNDPRKIVAFAGQLLPEQKARWLIVQEARIALRKSRGAR